MKQLIVSRKTKNIHTSTGETYWTYYGGEMIEADTLDHLKARVKAWFPFNTFEFIPDEALEQQKLPLSFE